MNTKPLKISFFSSRLARHILTTFVACALIPVVVLASMSLYQVSLQLEEQAYLQLKQAAKNYGLSIFEHLLFCEDELKLVEIRTDSDVAKQQEKFDAIGYRSANGRYTTIMGDTILPPTLSDENKNHLEKGKTIAVLTKNKPPRIIIVQRILDDHGTPALLAGKVRGEYLWGLEKGNNLPRLTETAVLSSKGAVLFQTPGWPSESARHVDRLPQTDSHLHIGEEDWFVANRLLFLKAGFGMNSWQVMVMQRKAHVLAPIARFKLVFILSVILAMMMVLWLSLFHLRRCLEPIEALKNGARCIARREFNHRVEVHSRDEFRELAQSFNAMSSQLGQQFDFLSTQAKIDQATLMARSFNHIAKLSISHILADFPFEMVAICRVNVDDPVDANLYMGHANNPDTLTSRSFEVNEKDLKIFSREVGWETISDNKVLGGYLPESLLCGISSVTFFPVYVKTRLYAVLVVASPLDTVIAQQDLTLMRQIADHMAVAWSNVNLIRDLRRLTIGSMQALARAVDAKSSWTAGHSARVQQVSLEITKQMGLDKDGLERLRYGALLHDIGKIGIRNGILDKPGKMTDEEVAIIRQHPSIGDKILSPIGTFQDIIPIVRQHHEHWNGSGYPDELVGEAIVLEARILAVADVYDALVSDRPYRKGMKAAKVLSIIGTEAGRQFDPKVVAAFLSIMETKKELAA